MALFKGDTLIAGTNPSGGGGAGGGHVIQDSTGEEFEQRPALQFIGADVVDDDINEATQVITPSFREIQGDIPDTQVVCLDGAPIGAIIPYGAPISTLDANWLPCLGQAVSRVIYHELFAKIGTTYGAGDGITTFNVPNYGGRIPVGLDENDSDFDTLGNTLGEKAHRLTVDEIPGHNHMGRIYSHNYNTGQTIPQARAFANSFNLNGSVNGSWGYSNSGDVTNSEIVNTIESDYTGGNGTHNNLQPSIVTNYIIKAKQASTAVLQGTINNTYNNKINEVYSSSYINSNIDSKFNYSTSEQIVGTWINNKPIYRKVITGSKSSVQSQATKSNLNYDTIVRATGWMYSKYDQWWTIPTYHSETAYYTALYYHSTGVRIDNGANYSDSSNTILILEYTKTTD